MPCWCNLKTYGSISFAEKASCHISFAWCPVYWQFFDRDINCLIWKGGIYLNRCLSWRCMQLLILHCLILMYLSVWEMSLTEVHAVYVHCALITIKAIREDKNFLSNKLLEKWFATYLLRNHLKSMTWPFLKIWSVSFQT